MPEPTRGLTVPAQVTMVCDELKRDWQVRNTRFKTWYDILKLKDKLKQTNMESFVTNDPRTFYNLALHLLTPDVIPHKLKETGGGREELARYAGVNTFIEGCWDRLNRLSRRRGRQSWLRSLVGLILATGWYSVFAIATEDVVMAEVWNPAEVFPDFGDEDLLRVAHSYTISPRAARRKLALHPDWKYTGNIPNYPMEIRDYWYLDGEDVRNVVTMGTQIVKPDQVTDFTTIPILVSPVGGLPDRGTIVEGDEWKEDVGLSILATNESVYHDYNKQMSFLQQLLRDTAQSKWFEKSSGTAIVTDPDQLFERGALFRGTPNDSLDRLDTGQVPVDIRTMLFDIRGMLQRGSLPDSLFGNVQQEIASYLMSQIASAAHQVLDDYRDATRAVLEDVDKLWLSQMQEQNLHPYEYILPPDLPEELEMDVGLEISIPGDLVQRVSVGRMANPDFRISVHTILSLLMPEIRNPLEEQAKANAEMALTHPVAQAVSTIQAWRQEAIRLREAGDTGSADLFEKAADRQEAMLGQEGAAPGAGGPPPPGRNGGMAGEPIPREMMGEGV